MNKSTKVCGFYLIGITILVFISCSGANQSAPEVQGQNFSAIKTIGLFPATYAAAYGPPSPSDLRGTDLSAIIHRQIKKQLNEKGYSVQSVAFKSEPEGDERFVPLQIDPGAIVANTLAETDGLMQVHVTFHFGIYPTERSSDVGPFSVIYLNANARLIDKTTHSEIWRATGRARPFKSPNFFNRLNFAVYTLVQGLLSTFPEHKP